MILQLVTAPYIIFNNAVEKILMKSEVLFYKIRTEKSDFLN